MAAKSINKTLAIIALTLGVLALIIGTPAESKKVEFSSDQLSTVIEDKGTAVCPVDIANWIIKSKADFILVDLRNEEAYKQANIPGAVCLSMEKIESGILPKDQKIILYSDNDEQTAKALLTLQNMKYDNVQRVYGNYEAWDKYILNPDISSDASAEEMTKFNEAKVIARYFGGTPTIDGEEIEEGEMELKISKPVAAAPANLNANKKKPKKEGC